MHDQHLTIRIGSCTNTDHRCSHRLGNPCGQRRGHAFQQDGVRAGGHQFAGVLDHQLRVLLIPTLNLETAKLVDELWG